MGRPDRLGGDLLVIPKPIDRFGGRPIPTGLGHARFGLVTQIGDDADQPLAQPAISKLGVSDFLLRPGLHLLPSFLSVPLLLPSEFLLLGRSCQLMGNDEVPVAAGAYHPWTATTRL